MRKEPFPPCNLLKEKKSAEETLKAMRDHQLAAPDGNTANA
jgi:hypothetical protein